MRILKANVILGALALLVGIAGCGGGSSTTIPSYYVGPWNGTWSQTNSTSGTESFTVDTSGNVTGTILQSPSTNGTVSGTIDTTGNASLTYIFPTATYTAKSELPLIINAQGQLVGTMSITTATTTVGTQTFELTN